MEKGEFRARIQAVGLTSEEFAALMGVSLRTFYDWGGRSAIPYAARLVLMLLEERGGSHGLLGRPAGPGLNVAAAHI